MSPKFRHRLAAISSVILAVYVLASASWGSAKESGRQIDSGVFDIIINGKQVATEKFDITQQGDGSDARGTLKTSDGSKESQSYELQFSSTGELRRYEWNESGDVKSQSTIEPQNEFLVQHITSTSLPKPVEQPYVLPPSTMVLDDYFFSHRELLLWRYLGMNCAKQTAQGCPMPKTQFGVIVPRQRTSMSVSMEFKGREDLIVRGKPMTLSRFDLHTESADWSIWMDDQYKVQRITVPSEGTEALRE